jgi:hypothetical protein
VTDKLQTAIDRGHRAKNILNDELFKEADAHIESEIFRKFAECLPDDERALKHIKAMQYFHAKYRAFLQRAVNDGKMAQLEVERDGALRRGLRKVIG